MKWPQGGEQGGWRAQATNLESRPATRHRPWAGSPEETIKKQSTKPTKRRAIAQVHSLEPVPRIRKQHEITNRTKLTNAHLPELVWKFDWPLILMHDFPFYHIRQLITVRGDVTLKCIHSDACNWIWLIYWGMNKNKLGMIYGRVAKCNLSMRRDHFPESHHLF